RSSDLLESPNVNPVIKPIVFPASAPASLQQKYRHIFLAKKPDIKKTPNVSNILKPSSVSTTPTTLPIAKKRWEKPVIVIDPGHGGKDSGAIGKGKTWEKRITLSYSLALKEALERTGKYRVVLTRSNDTFVSLPGRVKAARRAGGDILLSIHADSHPNPNTQGFSVYTLSADRAEREYQKLLAQSDYEEVVRGVKLRGESRDVKEAILDFAQNETKNVSDEFAKVVARNLGKNVKALPRTHREASLAVLTAADMPSALLELGYLSNVYEENLLNQKSHKEKIINSIKNAIDEYFRTHDYMI
ncbi:MAG TPA: N-acetylmuramoyl-L-alanine amidase, partial [Alphaproteobacteria bacterium]|nr:N-acetylmuramoyl-L-alanine amidase [Alphaproteobacteria bacterium]